MASIDDYEVVCKVGQGAFGSVFKARRKSDDALRVLKVMDVVGLSRREQEDALNEVKILASLRHEHIVRYDDSFVAGNALAIVMEYCEKGDLHHALRAREGKLLPEPRVWRYLLHTLLGLHYIHAQRVLHRDLKTMNLFLSASDTVLIGDFGVARLMGSNTHFAKTMVGTPYYLSPELCEGQAYNDKSDMWALGCILYELCTLCHPFDAGNHGALILKIIRGKFPPPSADYSRPLRELVGLLLSRRTERRPSAAALLAHPAIGAKAAELGIELPPSCVAARAAAHRLPARSPQAAAGQPPPPPPPSGVGGARTAMAGRGPFPQRQAIGGNRVRRMGPSGLAHPATGRLAAAANRTAAVALAIAGQQAPAFQPAPVPQPQPGAIGSPGAGGAWQPPRSPTAQQAPVPRVGGCCGAFVGMAARAALAGPGAGPRGCEHAGAPSARPPSVSQLQALERGQAHAAAGGASFVPSQPPATPRSRAEEEEIAGVRSLGSGSPAARRAGAAAGGERAEAAEGARALPAPAGGPAAVDEPDGAPGERRAAAQAALPWASPPPLPNTGEGSPSPGGGAQQLPLGAQGGAADEEPGAGGAEPGREAEAEEEAEAADQLGGPDGEGVPAEATAGFREPAWHGKGAAAVGWRVLPSAPEERADEEAGACGEEEEAAEEEEEEAAEGEEEEIGFAHHMRTVREEEEADGEDGDTFALAPGGGWAEARRGGGGRESEEENRGEAGQLAARAEPAQRAQPKAARAARARAAAAASHLRSLREHASELQAACEALVSPAVFAEIYAYFCARASESDAELTAEPAAAGQAARSDAQAAELARAEGAEQDALVAYVYERIPLDKSEVLTKIFQLLYLQEEMRELQLVASLA